MTTMIQAPALPAWASERWATDAPAGWARDLLDSVRVIRWRAGGPYCVLVRLASGEWAELDATTAHPLLALIVSAGGAP